MGVILAGVSLTLWCPKNVQVDFRFPLAISVFLDAFSVICLTLVQKIAVETAALFRCAREGSGQGHSSVRAAIDPAAVHRRVLNTFADVPLNAGRLVALQVSTALQEQQRRSQERGFDDVEHARDPLLHNLPKLPLRQARRRGRRHPPCPRKMDDDDPQKAGENVAH
jgi:hypothetical protein